MSVGDDCCVEMVVEQAESEASMPDSMAIPRVPFPLERKFRKFPYQIKSTRARTKEKMPEEKDVKILTTP